MHLVDAVSRLDQHNVDGLSDDSQRDLWPRICRREHAGNCRDFRDGLYRVRKLVQLRRLDCRLSMLVFYNVKMYVWQKFNTVKKTEVENAVHDVTGEQNTTLNRFEKSRQNLEWNQWNFINWWSPPPPGTTCQVLTVAARLGDWLSLLSRIFSVWNKKRNRWADDVRQVVFDLNSLHAEVALFRVRSSKQ